MILILLTRYSNIQPISPNRGTRTGPRQGPTNCRQTGLFRLWICRRPGRRGVNALISRLPWPLVTGETERIMKDRRLRRRTITERQQGVRARVVKGLPAAAHRRRQLACIARPSAVSLVACGSPTPPFWRATSLSFFGQRLLVGRCRAARSVANRRCSGGR